MDLLNPSKAIHTKNIACQNALKTAAQAAKTALEDPTQRTVDEAAFKAQSKYTTLFGYLFHEEWMSYEE